MYLFPVSLEALWNALEQRFFCLFVLISLFDISNLLPSMLVCHQSFVLHFHFETGISYFFPRKTSLMLCLLYKMDQLSNSFPKQLSKTASIKFNFMAVAGGVLLLNNKGIFSIDCQEGNKDILLISFQFVILIFSRLLSWTWWTYKKTTGKTLRKQVIKMANNFWIDWSVKIYTDPIQYSYSCACKIHTDIDER